MKRSKLVLEDTQRVLIVGALSEAAGVWEQMAQMMHEAGHVRLARMMLAGSHEARQLAHTMLRTDTVELTLREELVEN